MQFRPNSPPVIQETIEQETIMVNLDTGSYYSLNPVGSYVWGALESGVALDDIAPGVVEAFSAEHQTADQDVRAFVDRLVEEELVVPRDGDAPEPRSRSGAVAGGRYERPEMNRYTDMQELLLLDPVHEVDAAGWPARG